MLKIKHLLLLLSILLLFISCKTESDKVSDEVKKLYQTERYEEAIILATKAIEKNPDDARFYYYRGYCFYITDNPKAKDDFLSCIKIDKDYGNGYYGLAMIYKDEEKFGLSEKFFYHAIELAKDDERKATFLSGLSNLYVIKKDAKKAIEYIKQAISLDDKSDYYLNYGQCLYLNDQDAEAESTWLKGIEQNRYVQQNFKHETYRSLAAFYYHRQEYQKAKDFIERAIALAPDNKYYMESYKKIESHLNKK